MCNLTVVCQYHKYNTEFQTTNVHFGKTSECRHLQFCQCISHLTVKPHTLFGKLVFAVWVNKTTLLDVTFTPAGYPTKYNMYIYMCM
jgi:hypothetical protein